MSDNQQDGVVREITPMGTEIISAASGDWADRESEAALPCWTQCKPAQEGKQKQHRYPCPAHYRPVVAAKLRKASAQGQPATDTAHIAASIAHIFAGDDIPDLPERENEIQALLDRYLRPVGEPIADEDVAALIQQAADWDGNADGTFDEACDLIPKLTEALEREHLARKQAEQRGFVAAKEVAAKLIETKRGQMQGNTHGERFWLTHLAQEIRALLPAEPVKECSDASSNNTTR